jgi:hypothetical protein
VNPLNDLLYDQFQNTVDEVLVRHASVLDIMTKLEASNARINRSVVKSITSCGCTKLNAQKNEIPEGTEFYDLKKLNTNQLSGELCATCREKVEQEIGSHLFYLTALCNQVDVNLYDVILQEFNRIKVLGPFSLY